LPSPDRASASYRSLDGEKGVTNLSELCRYSYECLFEFFLTTIGLTVGIPSVVMTIHTFGDYMEKFHPHPHAMVSGGLFRKLGTFYAIPKADLEPLEEIFRAKV